MTKSLKQKFSLPVSLCAMVLATLACFAFARAASSAAEQAAADLGLLEQATFQAALDRVAPAVVRIETVGGLERVNDVLFGTGPTTGLIVDPAGYVISSAFNFVNQPSSILVRLPDGTRKPAELVATDHSRMLVLLKINAAGPLPVCEGIPTGEMRVGQWAIAVGRTFENDRPNMTVGVVSALGRVWGKAIQTDARVSPNNYGGPLVDIRGRVFGVIVPLSPESADELAGVEWYDSGIGFAVPIEHIRNILPRLRKGEDLYPGLIGITFKGSLLTGDATIAGCPPRSPAADAGFKRGDKIVEIDGHNIRWAAELKQELGRRYAGDKVRVVALRGNDRIDRELQLVAKLEPYQHAFLGILPMRTTGGTPAVTVRYIYPAGPLADRGIESGDQIVALAGKPVQDRNALREQVGELRPADEVDLEVRHAGNTRKLKVKLGQLPEELPPAELPPARHAGKPATGERPPVGTVAMKIPEFTNDAWAYVPDAYDPIVPHGVVVWLHGGGEFDHKQLIARWKPLCDRFDLLLLAPKAADPEKWDRTDLDFVTKLLDKVIATYTIDPTRIVVHGRERGGSMAYLLAFREHETIRAVAAVDAVPAGRPPENDPVHRMAVYTTTAKKSRQSADVDRAVKQLRDMKIPVTIKDLGESPRNLDPEETAELARWIDMLDRI